MLRELQFLAGTTLIGLAIAIPIVLMTADGWKGDLFSPVAIAVVLFAAGGWLIAESNVVVLSNKDNGEPPA